MTPLPWDAGSLGFGCRRAVGVNRACRADASAFGHTASLPLAVDAAYPFLKHPIQIHGTAPTLASVRRHLFNEEVWVRFYRLSLDRHEYTVPPMDAVRAAAGV